ncbi:MAG: hypothetical protein COA69_03030 [Robiginitomaculum sp.]|nr:MAG: hypothetical protein COA69_03030 [Robiginitomaculum sp.]
MKKIPYHNKQIRDEAAEWAVLLDIGGLTPKAREALAAWLLISSKHVHELLLATTLYENLGEIPEKPALSIEVLLAEKAPEIIPLISNLPASHKSVLDKPTLASPTKPAWGRNIAAMLAFIVLGLVGLSSVLKPVTPPLSAMDQVTDIAFETVLGEQRKMTLEDGSTVHVNTQSEVIIRYEDTQRIVELIRGEALFDVAHDPSRPFRVLVGDTIVEAIGTKFNIYRLEDTTSIAVIEGKVAVETENQIIRHGVDTPRPSEDTPSGPTEFLRPNHNRLLLIAGQQAYVAKADKTVHVAEANIKAVKSWSVGQLIFEGDDLDTIITQFNRYNHRRILIENADLASLKLSGVFDVDDPESLIKTLELLGEVKVDRSDPAVIRLRTP